MEPAGRTGSKLYILTFIAIFIPVVSAQWNGNLSAYEIHVASFDDPFTTITPEPVPRVDTQLDHFAVHPGTGDVYVGALNFLYRLNENLKQVANRSTGRNDESYKNYNKILLLYDGRVIECGSEDTGKCYSRGEDNLVPDGDEKDQVVAFGERTTVGVIARAHDGQRLYIAATYSVNEYEDIPAYSRRRVGSIGFLFADSNNNILLSNDYKAKTFKINYVHAFAWKGYTYFVAVRRESIITLDTTPYLSVLNRVCHTSTNLDSYTEILIECQGYRLIQAAHVGPAGSDLAASLSLHATDQVLYAVFARSVGTSGDDLGRATDDSAVCVYRMSDIEDEFKAAVRGCLTVGTGYEAGYLDGADCPGNPSTTDIDQYLCVADGYQYASGILPVVQSPVVRLPGHLGSSIITSTERNHTIAYIGTAMGQLLKVHVENGSEARLYEQVHLDGNPVRSDITINETSGEMLVLTKKKLIRMRVENCRQYTTCESCIGTEAGMDGDPYCGWCTLERKCTRYDECPMPDVATRWLAYNEAQCIEITDVAPHHSLPITVTRQQIILTVQRLPDLPNDQQYNCEFQTYSIISSKSGDELQCTTPPGSAIPSIENGEDHVTVELRVHSTETGVAFVETEFSFYKCSTHTSCVSCVGSRWACNWCVFENRCTHNNATCGSGDTIITGNNTRGTKMEGPDACPQIQSQFGEILVPNGVGRRISVNTSNLPDSKIKRYECSLTVDETQHTVAASASGAMITCDTMTYTYSANEQDLNVILTLKWIDDADKGHVLDDRYGFTVTLYKCEVNRPDCSRCVSNENTRAELDCVWCKQTCVVDDGTVCDSDKVITPLNGKNCPNPVIKQIYPTSGPKEGNTIITVTGTDLGRQVNDILNVTVGGQLCNIRSSNDSYKIGSSLDCITKGSTNFNMQDVLVTITGADGSLQTSTGNKFQYKDPMVKDFDPKKGPQSGGTEVKVSGKFLDAGRNIEVFINGRLCKSDRGEISDEVIVCRTPKANETGSWEIKVSFDGAVRSSKTLMFMYALDPTVNGINPTKSVVEGGRELQVNGSGFSIIQQPMIRVVVNEEPVARKRRKAYPGGRQLLAAKEDQLIFTGNCSFISDDNMTCISPKINLMTTLTEDSSLNLTTGFIMDGVTRLLNWCTDSESESCRPLEYFQNPIYYPFHHKIYAYEDGIFEKDTAKNLIIRGEALNLAISNKDVTVYIGPEQCTSVGVTETALSCILPESRPAEGNYQGQNKTKGLPVVWVIHGTTLEFNIGYIRYPTNFNVIIACVVSASVLLIVFILACLLFRKSKKAQKEVDNLLDEIDEVQNKLGDDMKSAFVELQTDLTDLTRDLEGVGMPFVDPREYAVKMLFSSLETQPTTTEQENPEEHVERAMIKFSRALSNKTFLLTFIQTLDAQSKSKLPVRQKAEIASLLTIVMVAEDKMDYLTDVLFSLMSKLIQDELDEGRQRQLFRRTETILEKLLSNWITLSLYDYLKDHTAHPLFMLYRAIKCNSEHGPIDIISGKAKFTLSDEKLLTEEIDYNELTLNVVVNNEDGETKEVKVLDVDSISQAKEKILDAIHRNQPYSHRPSANQVNLEWRQGQAGQLVLSDVDISNQAVDGWKHINTLRSFKIPNMSKMALIPVSQSSASKTSLQSNIYENFGFASDQPSTSATNKRSNRYTMIDVDSAETAKLWHLAKPEDGDFADPTLTTKPKTRGHMHRISVMATRPRKRFREVYIPRLISTKGTIKKYIDDMFQAVLNADTTPNAVKYLFDFFDSQSVRHTIQDSDAIRIWKGNSLSLRFWSNVIRRPDFIFDIRPSRSVEASLGVIAQAFYDAHNATDEKLGKDSDLGKLLFKQELKKIDGLVSDYYYNISTRQRVTLQTLKEDMSSTCQKFTGLFSKLSTLLQLWDHVKDFNEKIVEALEENEACVDEHLPYKLVEVETILSNRDCDEEHPV